MKLLTKADRAKLTRAAQAGPTDPDPTALVKFFTPDSSWTWYATEAEEIDGDVIFFGLVDGGHFAELGSFALSDLTKARGPYGLPIERDKAWSPKPVSAIRTRGMRA